MERNLSIPVLAQKQRTVSTWRDSRIRGGSRWRQDRAVRPLNSPI